MLVDSSKWSRSVLFVLLSLLITFSQKLQAQCNNWSISATLVNASTCAGNGGFNVSVSGPDAANLFNLQYGIPIAANGFSLPLNNTPNFTGIPAGTYQVSAVANCGLNIVGKVTSIRVPGNYTVPAMQASVTRNTLSCIGSGIINLNISNGAAPYSVKITNAPAAYAGPTTFSTTNNNYSIGNLPAGNYTVQVVDVCGSGTVPATLTVTNLSLSTLQLAYNPNIYSNGCNAITVPVPSLVGDWSGYTNDPLLKFSARIDNGVSASTPLDVFIGGVFNIPFAPGKTLKDCYGQNIIYTVQSYCGAGPQGSQTLAYPKTFTTLEQNCNIDFKATINFNGLLCFPISYTVRNNVSGTSYGPFTNNGTTSGTTSNLPISTYIINYTTADGYNGTGTFGTANVTSNPYKVSIITDGTGLNNYIDGFRFETNNAAVKNKRIELFSGPAGYAMNGVWASGNTLNLYENMNPGPTTQYFKQGNYVWKITDDCGTYFLPITVTAQDVYQYTVRITNRQQTCDGLYIWLDGTAKKGTQTMPLYFSVVSETHGFTVGSTGSAGPNIWLFYPNTPIKLTQPGTYRIITTSFANSNAPWYLPFYPNPYTVTDTITYTVTPLKVDVNSTQGFICRGTGTAEIYAGGTGGLPYVLPVPHYKYSLAASGNGATGPYMATNTTGVFTGFGGNAGNVYDVKVEDSCGAFAVQTVKILDLGIARLISSSKYVACDGGDVQLSGLFLPNATYSWTGPNGFTSSIRNPLITNVGPQQIGTYRLTVTTTQCTQTLTDTTVITVNGKPPKPLLNLDCDSPVTLMITNFSSQYKYEWEWGSFYGGYYANRWRLFPANVYQPTMPGSFKVIATDTTTGCEIVSDSVMFADPPGFKLVASIYAPHLLLCTGDTAILVADGTFLNSRYGPAKYQWFKDGLIIPGATSDYYITAVAGNYKVRIETSPCSIDTSDEVTVSIVPPPSASLSASAQNICDGDTAILQAVTGPGYMYTWFKDNATVPGAQSSSLAATQAGSYYVVVSNGGCVTISTVINISTYPKPIVNLTPNTTQTICSGNAVLLTTPANAAYTYAWQKDGVIIPGAATNTYNATTTGVYTVSAASAYCPTDTSAPVTINVTIIPQPTFTASAQDICKDDSTVLRANTGTSYTYTWYKNGVVLTGKTADTLKVGETGNYSVAIIIGACSKTSNVVTVTVHDKPIVNLQPATTQTICAGNSVLLSTTANSAYTYVWQKDNTPIPGAATNTYTASTTGDYTVSVTSPYCPTVTAPPVTVNVTTIPQPTLTAFAQDICKDDSALLRVNTGTSYTYTWYKDGIVITGKTADSLKVGETGNYSVATIIGACSKTSAVVAVTVHPKPVVNLIPNTTQTVCTGDIVHFSTPANTSYTYVWEKDNAVIPTATTNTYDASAAGAYRVSVTSPYCPAVTSPAVTITTVTLPQPALTASSPNICEGDTATLRTNTSNTYTYTWHKDNAIVPGITADSIQITQSGSYTAAIIVGACVKTSVAMQVTVHAKPIVDLAPATAQGLCSGKPVKFSTPANGVYSYTWYKDDIVIPTATNNNYDATAPGVYKVRVVSPYCPADTSVAVVVSPLPSGVVLPADTIICNDAAFAIPLSVDALFDDVLWSNGATTHDITITESGKWWVQVSNACGTFSDTIYVRTLKDILPGLPADTLICNKDNKALFSIPAVLSDIRWSTGATTPALAVTQPGIYWVQAHSVCGIVYDTMSITFCAPVVNSLHVTTDTICIDMCINFNATTTNFPQQYVWSFEGGNPVTYVGETPPSICYQTPGIYNTTLTVTNAGGEDHMAMQVVVLPQPRGRFVDTNIQVKYNTVLLLPACSNAEIVRWYKDDSLLCENCSVLELQAKYWQATYYCVLQNGDCLDTCIYKVNAMDIPPNAWLPDAFTPNGDGRNDYFHIITDNPNIDVLEFSIYNRWGQKIFTATGMDRGWDGAFHGTPVDLGTYVWYLRYKVTGNDEVFTKKGDVSLLR